MTQRRDERHADAGSIEELGSVALPTRVGSGRSALIPAFVVGALLVAVVAVGVSGRTEVPRDPVPPVAGFDASPTPPAVGDPTHTPAPQRGGPRLAPTPGQPEPPSVDALPEIWWPSGELRFWLVLDSDDERLISTDLEATEGFYQAVPMTGALGDAVRARLFGRLGGNDRLQVADVLVPRVPDGSLDLPLELGGGPLPLALRTQPEHGWSVGPLHYQLRLEQSRGRPGSPLLVAEVFAPYTTTYSESSSPSEARDRVLASAEVQEALTLSTRCSRMLDPRIGRSEANLDGCLRFFARQGVTWTVTPGTSGPIAPTPSPPASAPVPPAAPDGATYWLDLRLDGELINLQPLVETADGRYQASFPYPETWYVEAPVLGLYGHNTIDGWPVTMTALQLTKGPRGVPGLPVELASAPSPLRGDAATIWSVTLIRGQPHGLAVVVDVRP